MRWWLDRLAKARVRVKGHHKTEEALTEVFRDNILPSFAECPDWFRYDGPLHDDGKLLPEIQGAVAAILNRMALIGAFHKTMKAIEEATKVPAHEGLNIVQIEVPVAGHLEADDVEFIFED